MTTVTIIVLTDGSDYWWPMTGADLWPEDLGRYCILKYSWPAHSPVMIIVVGRDGPVYSMDGQWPYGNGIDIADEMMKEWRR